MKLSRTQRDALEWLYVDGSPRCHEGASYDPALNTLRSLVRAKLAKRVVGSGRVWRQHFAFTDAGRAALSPEKP